MAYEDIMKGMLEQDALNRSTYADHCLRMAAREWADKLGEGDPCFTSAFLGEHLTYAAEQRFIEDGRIKGWRAGEHARASLSSEEKAQIEKRGRILCEQAPKAVTEEYSPEASHSRGFKL